SGLSLTLIGIGLGTIGAFFVTRLLTDFLFGVKPADAVTFAGVAVVLGAVALLASYIPARPATKVDPMVTLRAEGKERNSPRFLLVGYVLSHIFSSILFCSQCLDRID